MVARRPAGVVVRSYLGYYAGSHQNSAAKRPWARIVLPWVTRWEVLVSYPFCVPHLIFRSVPFISPLILHFMSMDSWTHGLMDSWTHGLMDSWSIHSSFVIGNTEVWLQGAGHVIGDNISCADLLPPNRVCCSHSHTTSKANKIGRICAGNK